MKLHDDGGLIILAWVIGYFIFGGDPDIMDFIHVWVSENLTTPVTLDKI